MADATSLTPPGFSAYLCSQKGCESYSLKGPEKVNIITWGDSLWPQPGTITEVVISNLFEKGILL